MKLTGAGLTDVGLRRQHNEDSVFFDNKAELFLVADGVGGHASGEVASRMAVEVISGYMMKKDAKQPFIGERNDAVSDMANSMGSAIRLANQVIYESAQRNPSYQGMGSTIVAFAREGDLLSIAHVGDSRAYLIRDGDMMQMTDDHSLVAEQVRQGLMTEEQARTSKVRNVITRALGVAPEVEVDFDEMYLEPGDVVLACSDGLSTMVEDDVICKVVLETPDRAAACGRLVELANQGGGKDNITVVIADARKEGILSFFKKLFWR